MVLLTFPLQVRYQPIPILVDVQRGGNQARLSCEDVQRRTSDCEDLLAGFGRNVRNDDRSGSPGRRVDRDHLRLLLDNWWCSRIANPRRGLQRPAMDRRIDSLLASRAAKICVRQTPRRWLLDLEVRFSR